MSYYVFLELKFGVIRIVTMVNRPFAGKGSTEFGSVIFTRKDNHLINMLSDIIEKKFGAVDSLSLGGWHMAWFEFKK